ncbi:MAG: BamA/TamA family outer membrane protein [Holosporaceae bacterium]|jgi:translocation and assembly module TamA|nr:BamA/TamA family outer membrane protein [Holosporaceae bacterium]
MVLKKSSVFFLIFAYRAFCYDADFHDFNYDVEMILEKNQTIIGTFADMLSEPEIISGIEQLRTFSQQDKTVSNMRALKDRIANDVAIIHKKAHMLGYYGTKINYSTHVIDSKNVKVKLHINLGKKFNLKLNVQFLNQDNKFNSHYKAILQEELKKYKASVEEIKAFIGVAIHDLQENGFFKPEIIEKKVHIDEESHEAILNLVIDPGKKVFFSNVKIKSFPGVHDTFVKNRIEWEENQLFDISKVESTADNLKNTQIFSKIKIKPNEEGIHDEKIPMTIELQEDKKRSIDISLLYSGMRNMNFEKKSQTQKRLKSIIARFGWTNYNTFGSGEKLSFIIEGTPMRAQEKRSDYAFEITMAQPDVFLKNNTTNYSISRKQELTNVFFKKNDNISIKFSYPMRDYLLVKIGGTAEKNYVDTNEVFFRNKDNRKKYDCFTIPLELILDRTDDLLNPTSGYRATIKFAEILFKNSTIDQLRNFDIWYSYNYSLDNLKRTVLAFNVSWKSIFGQQIDAVPVDKRIYAGGMNSVRGYANQMAAEMIVSEDTPMGGKNSIEFNAEIRRRISADFGAVIFFDGAKIFNNKSCYADLQTEKKRWFNSFGLGIRYFTSIGPIRVDFAFPIKRRKGIDSKMQFIMSLGQAF